MLARQAARSLRFAQPLRDIAERIRQDVTGGADVPLNGVHLRLEVDAVAAWLGHTTEEVRLLQRVCQSPPWLRRPEKAKGGNSCRWTASVRCLT